jgi:hypothetical protein
MFNESIVKLTIATNLTLAARKACCAELQLLLAVLEHWPAAGPSCKPLLACSNQARVGTLTSRCAHTIYDGPAMTLTPVL